jgi:hypothetical protein
MGWDGLGWVMGCTVEDEMGVALRRMLFGRRTRRIACARGPRLAVGGLAVARCWLVGVADAAAEVVDVVGHDEVAAQRVLLALETSDGELHRENTRAREHHNGRASTAREQRTRPASTARDHEHESR